MLTRRIALTASLALVASCSSDKTTAANPLNGTVSFTYSGAISGTFNATGSLPVSQAAMETSSWAAGEVSVADGATAILSATPRSATSHDFIVLGADRITAGTAPIDDTCTVNCGIVFVTFGQGNGTSTAVLFECFLTVGSFTITEVTTTRVRGTFSGTGECFAPGSNTPEAFTVTNGTFDVALVSGLP